ncbi:MAG: hypothetical protein DHS20C14_07470 [Phycisphaeraceae bacterium]|nr:MAG: hypothetical protein DHS20C14_07470 [Phycisphaeraceae bacterium]
MKRPYRTGALGPSRRGGAKLGCLIALGVFVFIIIAAVVYGMLTWKGWAATWAETIAVEVVQESNLEDTEKGEVLGEIRAVTEAFRSGDLSLAEAKLIFKGVIESPLLPAGMVYGMHTLYYAPSELSEEEKAAGKMALSRVARGLFDETIDPDRMGRVFGPISTTNTTGPRVHINAPEFQLHLKDPETTTADELREVTALAIAEADAAEVPNELYEVDVSDEIARAVQEAIGRTLPPSKTKDTIVTVPDEPETPDAGADENSEDDGP